jgi:hypothetical protein
MNKHKPLFNSNEQIAAIGKYRPFFEGLAATKSTDEWNELRRNLNSTFPGNRKEKLMVFGYIDGVFHSEVLKKRKSEAKTEVEIEIEATI